MALGHLEEEEEEEEEDEKEEEESLFKADAVNEEDSERDRVRRRRRGRNRILLPNSLPRAGGRAGRRADGRAGGLSALRPPCSVTQGQAESGGMVLVAYAGPVRPAAALRVSVLCLPTDIHSLFVNEPSSSFSSSS